MTALLIGALLLWLVAVLVLRHRADKLADWMDEGNRRVR